MLTSDHQIFISVCQDQQHDTKGPCEQQGTRSENLQLETPRLMSWAESVLQSIRAEQIQGLVNREVDWFFNREPELAVPRNINFQPASRLIWYADSVSVCLQEQCKGAEVFLQIHLSPGRRERFLPTNLAGGLTICISSAISSASVPSPGGENGSSSHLCCSFLEIKKYGQG